MCKRGALILALFLFVVAIFLLVPSSLLADGGHGSGITFPAGAPSSEAIDTTINFSPYHHLTEPRIEKDFNLLLSDSVVARMAVVEGNIQEGVNKFLEELDLVPDNEFNLPYHDFALVYNYFARPDTLYGQRVRDDGSNVLFNLSYPDSEENHVDLYLAGYWAEQSAHGWAGVYPSDFWDWDEDSTSFSTTCHLNSLSDYDGPNGLEVRNPDWYKSGGACNVRFTPES